jgi:hypothetical protein
MRKTISVADEPQFDPCLWAMAKNVLAAQDWLRREFNAASIFYHFEPSASNLARISEPPKGVMDFTLGQRFRAGEPNRSQTECEGLVGTEAKQHTIPGPIGLAVSWEKDAAAALFAYETDIDPETKWEELSKPDRRKAWDSWEWWSAPNRIRRKGAAIKTDIPLLLYLIFAIEELIHGPFPQAKFPRSRRPDLGDSPRPPTGPAFRLLRAAYIHVLVKLHVMPSSGLETFEGVIRAARQDKFRDALRCFRLRNRFSWIGSIGEISAVSVGDSPYSGFAEVVAEYPNECALLYAEHLGAARRKQDSAR